MKQTASGKFVEIEEDQLIYPTELDAYTTAFVRIAMYESGDKVNEAADTWLAKVFNSLSDPLDIIPACYALTIVKNDISECYEKVLTMMTKDAESYFWTNKVGKADLHLTAYGLMILVEHNSFSPALKVFKYLLSNQDQHGFFHQDGYFEDSYVTSICTEALMKFIRLSAKYKQATENIFIDYDIDGQSIPIHLRPKVNIPEVVYANATAKTIKIKAEGYGQAKVNLYYQYNVNNLKSGNFNISAKAKKINEDYVELDICIR